MNNRFKFRAWNKLDNYITNIPVDCFGAVVNCENFIIMQCTGLKDKNGKLIYEGDIVKSDFTFLTAALNPLSFDVGDVVFQKHFGGYVINSTQNAVPYQQAHIDSTVAANCEVIGNIYENKELLNE